MSEVQSIGTVDYQKPVIQPQEQYIEEIPSDINNSPLVYDPEIEAKRRASSKMLGLTALGLIAAGGLGFWAGHAKGAKNLAEIKETLKQINKEANEFVNECWLYRMFKPKTFAKKIADMTKKFINSFNNNH